MKYYFTEILAFVGGGGLLAFFNYFKDRRSDSVQEFVVIIEKYKDYIKEIEQQNDEKVAIIKANSDLLNVLNEEVNKLKAKIIIIENTHLDFPFPTWLKDRNGIVLAVNESYEEEFLKPIGKTMMDYIGKSDYDMWSKEVADQYTLHDTQLLRGKENVWMGEEMILLNDQDESEHYRIVKFKRWLGNTVIGLGGFAIRIRK
jgi:hypothetical protein